MLLSVVIGSIVTANGWRYEKLPFAGDFLSRYTKVEAGYNPLIYYLCAYFVYTVLN